MLRLQEPAEDGRLKRQMPEETWGPAVRAFIALQSSRGAFIAVSNAFVVSAIFSNAGGDAGCLKQTDSIPLRGCKSRWCAPAPSGAAEPFADCRIGWAGSSWTQASLITTPYIVTQLLLCWFLPVIGSICDEVRGGARSIAAIGSGVAAVFMLGCGLAIVGGAWGVSLVCAYAALTFWFLSIGAVFAFLPSLASSASGTVRISNAAAGGLVFYSMLCVGISSFCAGRGTSEGTVACIGSLLCGGGILLALVYAWPRLASAETRGTRGVKAGAAAAAAAAAVAGSGQEKGAATASAADPAGSAEQPPPPLLPPPAPPPAPPITVLGSMRKLAAAFRRLFRDFPQARTFLAAYALEQSAQRSLIFLMSVYFIEKHDYSQGELAHVSAFILVLAVVGALLMRNVLKRKGLDFKRILVATSVIKVVAISLMPALVKGTGAASRRATFLLMTPVGLLFAVQLGLQRGVFSTIVPGGSEGEYLGLMFFAGTVLAWVPPLLYSIMDSAGMSLVTIFGCAIILWIWVSVALLCSFDLTKAKADVARFEAKQVFVGMSPSSRISPNMPEPTEAAAVAVPVGSLRIEVEEGGEGSSGGAAESALCLAPTAAAATG